MNNQRQQGSEPHRDQLRHYVCDALNADPPGQMERLLKEYVDAWLAGKLRGSRLWRHFQRDARHPEVIYKDAILDDDPPRGFRKTMEFLTRTPGEEAASRLAILLRNPCRRELRRCGNCNCYFVEARPNKTFCQRGCAQRATIQRGRKAYQLQKLRRVKKLLTRKREQGDWKRWVHNQFSKGDPERITVNWLTHMINHGLLTRTGKLTIKATKLLPRRRK